MIVRYRSSSAFTIVELLVVIVVIGILAAITIVSYSGITSKATIASLQSDLDNSSRLLKMYQVEHSAYPTSFDANNCPLGATAPSPDTKYCIKPNSGNTYTYKISATNSNIFCLTSTKGTQSYNISPDTQPLAGPCPVLSLDAGNKTSYSGSGTVWNDLSGNDNNSTLNGGVAYNAGNGGALSFDGIIGSAQLANSTSLNSTTITIGVWVRPNILSNHQRLVTKNSSAGYMLNIYSNFAEAYIGNQHITGPTLTINQWVYLLVTIDGTRLKFYSNGNIVNDFSYTGTINSGTSTLQIGSENGVNCLNGSIGNVSIYNSALSSSDVLQTFNATKARYGL